MMHQLLGVSRIPGNGEGNLSTRIRLLGLSVEKPAEQILAAMILVAVAGCGDRKASSVPTDPVEWLASQAIPVASVDPANRDFSDLQALKEVIGDSRVVLLGEQSHGEGTVFLAKTRLIEFLHGEMGFDVLAFESGLFGMRKAWQAMVDGQDPRLAFGKGVFGVWAGSAEVQPLIAYLAEVAATEHPLELAGFDLQFTANSRDSFLPDLEAFLEAEGSGLTADERWSAIRPTFAGVMDGGRSGNPSEEDQLRFREVMVELREWLGGDDATTAGLDQRFWSQMLKSTVALAEGIWGFDADNFMETGSYRDEQMADNLIWLTNDWYRGRKIIVWAATYHNLRNIRDVDTRNPDLDYSRAMTMGHRVWEALGDDVYNLGFTAYEGESGRWLFDSSKSLAVPTDGSLEDLMGRAGLQNAIVDFRSAGPALAWLSTPRLARPLGHNEMEADWTAVLDGIFFNRVMERSTQADTSGHDPDVSR
jgi:erythromycin esterase